MSGPSMTAGPMLIHWGYDTQAEALERARHCVPGHGMRIITRKRNGLWGVWREVAS